MIKNATSKVVVKDAQVVTDANGNDVYVSPIDLNDISTDED